MDHIPPSLDESIARAALLARTAGHTEVGPLHLFLSLLEADPQLAPELDPAKVKQALPASSTGELRFLPSMLRALEQAQTDRLRTAEPNEKHCLEALLEPGRALAVLAHHLGLDPDRWLRELVAPGDQAHALELRPEPNEWRMLLTWLENPTSQVRSWLSERELALALEWVARVVGPFPPKDTGWLARAKRYAVREGSKTPLSERQLFRSLLLQKEVALLHWQLGGNWLASASHYSFWHGPGLAVAHHLRHEQVTLVHALADCLNEPVLQATLNPLRQAVRKVLEGDGVFHSTPVPAALRRTVKACQHWNVEPARIHLAYVLLKDFDSEGIAEALEWSGREGKAWLKKIRRLMLGRLRPGPWLVDEVALGSPLSAQGPLLAQDDRWQNTVGTWLWSDSQGHIVRIQGTRLNSQGTQLLGPESRNHSAEALVGLGRLDRWLTYRDVDLKISCEAGCVSSIELRTNHQD
jgi:hypothetical protein